EQSDAEKIAGESTSFWKDAWRRFKQNKLAIMGIVIIILLAIMSIIGTLVSGQNYYNNDLLNANKQPSAEHWFGTDNLGRDIFDRTWYGARIYLFIGLTAVFIDLFILDVSGMVSCYIGLI